MKNCDNEKIFFEHVSQHIEHVKIKTLKSGSEVYVCQWEKCNYENTDAVQISRHVNFHAFHVKLKSYGSIVSEKKRLPVMNASVCKVRFQHWYVMNYARLTMHYWKVISHFLHFHQICRFKIKKNLYKNFPLNHLCEWENCQMTFSSVKQYLDHIHKHIKKEGHKCFTCKWDGCEKVYSSSYNFRRHLQTHAKECVVACANCGSIFANLEMFYRHLNGQKPIDCTWQSIYDQKLSNANLKNLKQFSSSMM